MTSSKALQCPFCLFADSDAYIISEHVEFCHPEGGVSPFMVREGGSPDPVNRHKTSRNEKTQRWRQKRQKLQNDIAEEEYVECPKGCGEQVMREELGVHLDLHVAEGLAFEEYGEGDHSDGGLPGSSSNEAAGFDPKPHGEIHTILEEQGEYHSSETMRKAADSTTSKKNAQQKSFQRLGVC